MRGHNQPRAAFEWPRTVFVCDYAVSKKGTKGWGHKPLNGHKEAQKDGVNSAS